MDKKTKISRRRILENLRKSKKLDMILVFGSLQEFGELQFFTGVKPLLYHYFFLKEGRPWESGYYMPHFLVDEVKKDKDVFTFDDQNIPMEMKKILRGKKRVGLIGGAPAFHFSESDVEIVFLNEEIWKEMVVKNSQEIKKIKSASEMAAKAVKLGGRMIKAGAALGKVAESLEKKVLSEGAGLAFPPIISDIIHQQNIFNWFSQEDKIAKKDAVMVNLGIEKDGFYADVARMFFVNQPELSKIYADLEKCYKQLVAEMKPGIVLGSLSDRMEKLLQKKNLRGFKLDKDYLGHLIGFEIIEHPFLMKNSLEKLKSGMTVSLLIKMTRGKSELRIQNVVLIGEKGGEILSA